MLKFIGRALNNVKDRKEILIISLKTNENQFFQVIKERDNKLIKILIYSLAYVQGPSDH